MSKRLPAAVCVFAALTVLSATAAAQQIITTVVGNPEVVAVAVDPGSGATYFATDRPGGIYRVTGAGPVLVAGVSGGPTDDGEPALQAAVFPGRNGLAIDSHGNIFFSEPNLHRIREISAAAGTVSTIAGTGKTSDNPSPISGNWAIFTALAAPGALAFDPATGDLFVADETWDIVYTIVAGGSPIAQSSALVNAVGGDRRNTNIWVESEFYNPFGYAGDSGPAIDAKLNHPRGLAFDAVGNLYIADTGNNVVRRVDTSNIITTFAGTSAPGFGGDSVPALSAQLFMPTGLAVDAAGDLLIADTSNHRVRMVAAGSSVMSTIAGTGSAGHAGDGSAATSAALAYPTGVTLAAGGAVLIVDSQNNRVRSIAADHTIGTVAQKGADYSGSGLPGGDAVNQPRYIVFDSRSNMFFSDSNNARVRRVDALSGQITTVAGNGIPGYDGDGAMATGGRLNCPAGLAFGPAGDLFIADPCAQVVRRVYPGSDQLITGAADETITTWAGNGIGDAFASSDGGTAAATSLFDPFSLAMDSTGTLYIGEPAADDIRTVDSTGKLGTFVSGADSRGLVVDSLNHVIVADDGEEDAIQCFGFSSIADPSQFQGFTSWSGLSLDGLTRLFVSDDASQAIFQVTRPGGATLCGGTGRANVTVIGGPASNTIGYSGDGGPATSALLNQPAGTAFDGAGSLYVADTGNNVIRRLRQPVIGVTTSTGTIDFGSAGVLATTPSQIVTVTSSGAGPATFAASTLSGSNPGDFIVTSDGCVGKTLSEGQTCQLAVAFRASVAGGRAATLLVNDNAPSAPQSVALTGIGTSLDVTPASLSFGDQAQGTTSAPAPVTVRNSTPSSMTILSLSLLNPNDFAVSADLCTSAVLAAGASCTFSVTFTPHALGSSGTTLNVTSTAGDSPRAIGVGGNGVPAVAKAQFSPASIAFGPIVVGTKSAATTVTLTSAGTGPLSVVKLALTGNQPIDFTMTNDTCTGATLTPGQNCTAQVTFAPAETCNSTASVQFTDNAPDSPQNVTLSGHGQRGPASLFQAASFCTSHGAAPQWLGAGADGNIWIQENGSAFAPPALGRLNAFDGLLDEKTGAIRSGYRPFELTMSPDGSYAYGEADRATPPNQSYVKIVNADGVGIESPNSFIGPIANGPDGGFLVANQFTCADLPLVTDFAPDGVTSSYTPTEQWIFGTTHHFCIQTSSLDVGPDGAVWIGTSNISSGLAGGTRSGFVRMTSDGTFVDFLPTDGPPAATATGVDGNFYALVANLNGACSLERFDSESVETTIALPASVSSLGCSGLGAGADGRLWMYGSTFTGSAFQATMVAFDPLTSKVSSYPMPQFGAAATLSLIAGPDEGIWFVAPPSALARFDIGGGPARAFVLPRVVSLPFTSLGVPSLVRKIYVRSTGTAPLTVSGVTVTGADASQFLLNDQCSGKDVAPGDFCLVLVASRPSSSGSHKATLLVNSNDGFSPQRVQLAEFALPPGPTIDPSSVAFPATLVGNASKSMSFVVTNPADRGVPISSVSLGGAHFGDFAILDDHCGGTTLPAGATCTVTVRFVPTTAGARKATLIVTDAASLPTQSTLSGTGQTSGGGGTSSACDCATGLFVDPAGVEPSVTSVSATTGTSPGRKYALTVTPGGPNGGPSQLAITKGGTAILTFASPADATWPSTVPAWGFSPDDDRFIVHYQTNGHDTIDLFNLAGSTPNVHVWEGSVLITSDGTGTVPSGSVAFSPGGNYIVATQIESTVGVGLAPSQTAHMHLVSSTGTVAGGSEFSWQLVTPPADPDKMTESAHWGFAPDDQSFVFIRDSSLGPLLDLISLPGGEKLEELTSTSSVAKYVQFGPCGEVLGVVDTSTASNPLTITLYSTRPADPRAPIAQPQTDLPAVTVVLMATPAEYTAHLAGFSTALPLATNTSAAGCAAPATSGDAGGSSHDTSPQFTTDTPAILAIQGQAYSYTFHAIGSPEPTYSLDPFAPSWLKIDTTTGEVSGTPPVTNVPGTITYSVTASNRASFDVAGPFTVTVSPASAEDEAGPGGPHVGDDDGELAGADRAPAQPLEQSQDPQTGTSTSLLLPNGRGQIQLPADVTPALSTFTYTETDAPTGPLGALVFAGLDFTLTAVDAATGSPVSTLTDAPRAILALRSAELRSARIRDLSRLGLYWWSGSAWVNQLPCAGCSISSDGATLTVALSRLGEYVLAATPSSTAVFSIAMTPIHVTVGQTYAGTVAAFPPAIPLDQASDYAAIVDWGDGQTSPAAVSAIGATFTASGAHAWTTAGSHTVSITIFDGGDSGRAHATAIVDPVAQAPQFTAAAPALTAAAGVTYSYTFAASGVPAPGFSLSGAPGWLTINGATGLLSGTPPSGTASFTYGVVASNGVAPDAIVGPFSVAVTGTSKNSADLSIAVTGPATAAKGSVVTYTITVKNNGPSTAVNGTVVLIAGPDATPIGVFIGDVGFWTWRFGSLGAGQSISFSAKVTGPRAGTLFALGLVGSDTPDPKPLNNLAFASTRIK